jgi:hypothetical protein
VLLGIAKAIMSSHLERFIANVSRFANRFRMTAEEQTLAKPSGDCCLKGYIHGGEARGTWKVISNVETYVSEPPEGKANGHILLYFPDVWGMFNNGFLVMDAFAEAGFRVFGIDYFRGVCFSSLLPVFDPARASAYERIALS